MTRAAALLWPDRTLKQNYGANFWNTIYTGLASIGLGFDKTSAPVPWGIYVQSWRNKDRAKPTVGKIRADVPVAVRELTEYRLDNDADGECTRVYLLREPQWAFKLSKPVSVDATEIFLEDVTNTVQLAGSRVAGLRRRVRRGRLGGRCQEGREGQAGGDGLGRGGARGGRGGRRPSRTAPRWP